MNSRFGKTCVGVNVLFLLTYMLKPRSADVGLRSLDDREIEISPLVTSAIRFPVTLWAASGTIFLTFLLNGGYIFWTAGPLQSALLFLQLFVAIMVLMAGSLAEHRHASGNDITRRNNELISWLAEVERAKDSKTDVVSRYYTPMYNVVTFERFIGWAPFALALAAIFVVFGVIRALAQPTPDVTAYISPGWRDYTSTILNILIAFSCVTLGSWLRNQPTNEFPEGRAIAAWFKALQWVSLAVAIVSLARTLNFDNVTVVLQLADAWVGRVLLILVLCVSLEEAAIAALASVAKRRDWQEFTLPFSAVFADNVFVSPRTLSETISTLENKLGLNVRSSYVIAQFRRSLPFLFVSVFGLLWLSTCLFTIGTQETGVLTRFGRRVVETPLGPGLHFKFPFPVDTIRTVSSERIKVAVVGAPLDTSQPVMWTKMHSTGDYNQVLGQGREVVSVHGRVFYRVKDAQDYLFSTQNPNDAVASFAYQVIMREVVSRNVDQLLSLDRVGFSDKLKRLLQAELDAQHTGIEVVSFPLLALHPPVDVAQNYQSVVSAQIASVTSATKANAERESKVPTAQAKRDVAIKTAMGEGVKRLGAASGEAAKFDSIRTAYTASPEDYKERLWLETMEDSLIGKKLFVIDRKAKSPDPEYTVDLRPAGSLP